MGENKIIAPHQLRFKREQIAERVQRLVFEIRCALKDRKYYPTVSLDVAHAFDNVSHEGFIYKVKKKLPTNSHKILELYFTDKSFA